MHGGNSDIFISKINSSGTALVYSTYLGGSGGDFESGIALDAEGAVYVTGATESSDFPTRNPIQGTYGGNRDSFVAKIDSAGSKLVYSTYLGGAALEEFSNITVDSEGAAYVTGGTKSSDFPIRNPFQKNNAGETDIFISKVSSEGSKLDYSTYLGGSGTDYGGSGIALDAEGAVYVTGATESSDFPTRNPIQ
ncbi:MAG: SBBP repeat-containing protein, partial [Candidatus Aminicenantaceae bacterium]